jgi:hypothetical protein
MEAENMKKKAANNAKEKTQDNFEEITRKSNMLNNLSCSR